METIVEDVAKAGANEEETEKGTIFAEETKKIYSEEDAVEIEPKTGVSFPLILGDGMNLKCVGLRKKSVLGFKIKIYGFGIYVDNEKLKHMLKAKIGKAPTYPTKEMYQVVIDSDVEMMVRLVIVLSGLTMNMVRNNIDEGLGASIATNSSVLVGSWEK